LVKPRTSPRDIAAVAFRFNPVTRWDFGSEEYPVDDRWPAKRSDVIDDLRPGLPVVAWQSGTPKHRGIRALGVIAGGAFGPLDGRDMPTRDEDVPGWTSLEEYVAVWNGAWEVPIRWRVLFDEPISADQDPVCRPIPQAPNPFPVSASEWATWKEAIDMGGGGPIDLE
jgi:hypothetical protein